MLSAFIVIIIIITFFYLFYLFAFIPFFIFILFLFSSFYFLFFFTFFIIIVFLLEAGLTCNMDNKLALFVHLQKFTFMCLIWSQGDHALPIFY